MRYISPLRYPGGKAKLAPLIQALFRANKLEDGHYAEVYAGGASIALTLLFEEYASRIHINDLDPAIYAFWRSVLGETEALCRLVTETKVSPNEWRRQREIQRRQDEVSILELGFSTFFLNRTNRSGIIASGGMIGGAAQEGGWKLDARYNAAELVRRIEKIARYRSRISLTRLDAVDFLAHVAAILPERSLAYLDPPYFVKGQRRLYASYYRPEDHEEIAQVLESFPHRWVVSYDAAPEILQLYQGHRQFTYQLLYTAAGRYSGSEVIVFSDHLTLPPTAAQESLAALPGARQSGVAS